MDTGLIDSEQFLVHPVSIGWGKRLCNAGRTVALTLADAIRFQAGALLRYHPQTRARSIMTTLTSTSAARPNKEQP